MKNKPAANASKLLTVNIEAAKFHLTIHKLCAENVTQVRVGSTIEHHRFQRAPMLRCKHDVYIPDEGTELAWSCTLCYPAGHPEAQTAAPVFNRRNSLNLTSTGKLPKCLDCDSILTVSSGGKCRHCGKEYELLAPEHLRANNSQPGSCPECGSGVHYIGKTKRTWVCADCCHAYNAPKRLE